jgi:epoxyqueuosine reductase
VFRKVTAALANSGIAIGVKIMDSPHMSLAPSLPARFRRKYLAPRNPWLLDIEVPKSLQGVPGIVRDPEAESAAFAAGPLPDFVLANRKPLGYLHRNNWRSFLPVAPRRVRAMKLVQEVNSRQPGNDADDELPEVLTLRIKKLGAELGFSAVGIAAYDPKYIFESYQGRECGDRIIVCILEQAWGPTQSIPSSASEQAALSTYVESMVMASTIADLLIDLGHKAIAYDPSGPGMSIHFAVAAGLGQLGLNGQLLSLTGSRCRILMINTNAPLELDEPKDFGVPALCDACQVCVRRCPPGAIPAVRKFKRGVEKGSLNTKRCLPIVAQAHGCAICMKVCPVQRYGLQEVLTEFGRSGKVLGKGTDELEGYHWPLDGKHYGPGEKPRITQELIEPPEMGVVSMGSHLQDGSTLTADEIAAARMNIN